MNDSLIHWRIRISGVVQGVGFRPFVYRLATESNLPGWVCNTPQGVILEIEGTADLLERFVERLQNEKPPHSMIQSLETRVLPPAGLQGFAIHASQEEGGKSALVLPDLATCPECLRELFDPENRRYLYPFTNCTHCGPRFSIIKALPYDRPNTSMEKFRMCTACQAEYENPLDRRFHAQPNACPECGPQLEFWNATGFVLSSRQEAMMQAAEEIRAGKIMAVKGLGGFHLMCDARNRDAVIRLRERKHREEKPLALMVPSMDTLREICWVSPLEETILRSSEAPIVLFKKNEGGTIAPETAPNNPYLGAMLPYTPLHHILMQKLGFPVVATSGNRSDEPICTDEREALRRLADIADGFLVHNRPIVRHVDDAIVRVMAGREQIVRRARGYAPLPIETDEPFRPILAVGAHLKNTIAISQGKNIFISQHIGDLENEPAYQAFREVIGSLQTIYQIKPERIVCDLHPDYLSTKYARETQLSRVQVQHHYAHVLSCMMEHGLRNRVLGVAWDGTGLGTDETIWGGEFLLCTPEGFERAAHLRTFPLPSGEGAVKQPCRTALGLLFEALGMNAFERMELPSLRAFSPSELGLFRNILVKKINAPLTSSTGRLFDAVASLLGLRQAVSFEGQAAMELEFLLQDTEEEKSYSFRIVEMNGIKEKPKEPSPAPSPQESGKEKPWMIDWKPMLHELLEDIKHQIPASVCSARFHHMLVNVIVDMAKRIGETHIVLTGGCFQNRYLCEQTVDRLRQEGFEPYWHQRVPPNDGGIAVGQILFAQSHSGKEDTPLQ